MNQADGRWIMPNKYIFNKYATNMKIALFNGEI